MHATRSLEATLKQLATERRQNRMNAAYVRKSGAPHACMHMCHLIRRSDWSHLIQGRHVGPIPAATQRAAQVRILCQQPQQR